MVDIVEGLRAIQDAQSNPKDQIPPAGFKATVAILHHGSPANEYPIGSFIQKIYVFENIESKGITGWCEILDTYNLVRNGLIIGEELLYLKFMTAGVDIAGLNEDEWLVDFTEEPLYVHKIEDMTDAQTQTGGKTQSAITYKLHFMSPELIRNNRIKISKTLQGTYTDIIKKILTTELKSTKALQATETEDLKHIIIPNIKPFQAIDLMTQSCQSISKGDTDDTAEFTSAVDRIITKTVQGEMWKGRMTDYNFWETSKGYKLMPTISPDLDVDFTVTVGGSLATPSYLGEMTTALSYSYDFHGDTYMSTKAGMWAAKQITHDSTNKYVNTYQSNYLTSIKDSLNSYVSETPVYTPSGDKEKNILGEDRRITDFPDSIVMMDTYNSGSVTNIDKRSGDVTVPWALDPYTLDLRKMMQVNHALNYYTMTLRIPGNSALYAGMNIKLDLPDVGRGSGFRQLKQAREVWENRLDNIWKIKKLVHVIDASQENLTYYCDLELSNSLRAIDKKLPAYDGLGSINF